MTFERHIGLSAQNIVDFEKGQLYDAGGNKLPDDATTIADLLNGFEALLSEVESRVCERAAYGFDISNPEHPWHEAVKDARSVIARFKREESKVEIPLATGTRIMTLCGEIDDDEDGQERSAEIGEIGTVKKVFRHPKNPEGQRILHLVVFKPSGCCCLLGEEDVLDATRYKIIRKAKQTA